MDACCTRTRTGGGLADRVNQMPEAGEAVCPASAAAAGAAAHTQGCGVHASPSCPASARQQATRLWMACPMKTRAARKAPPPTLSKLTMMTMTKAAACALRAAHASLTQAAERLAAAVAAAAGGGGTAVDGGGGGGGDGGGAGLRGHHQHRAVIAAAASAQVSCSGLALPRWCWWALRLRCESRASGLQVRWPQPTARVRTAGGAGGGAGGAVDRARTGGRQVPAPVQRWRWLGLANGARP